MATAEMFTDAEPPGLMLTEQIAVGQSEKDLPKGAKNKAPVVDLRFGFETYFS